MCQSVCNWMQKSLFSDILYLGNIRVYFLDIRRKIKSREKFGVQLGTEIKVANVTTADGK